MFGRGFMSMVAAAQGLSLMAPTRRSGPIAGPSYNWERLRRYRLRELKHRDYARNGLNGPRAVARRKRQIEAGQLQVSA